MHEQGQGVVELSGVRFSWAAGAPPAIDLESLRIDRGQRAVLHGPSGAGKSTLLNLLAGVAAPQAGTIRILGTDLGALDSGTRDRFRADHIGYIFQAFNLIAYLSVVENVCLPCEFSVARRKRALGAGASLQAEAMRLLRELDLGGERLQRAAVTDLSVGQQQRVAAARALIGAPELLIADEPTSSLDAARREAFLELLFRQCEREGTTLILASHDESLAGRFDCAVAIRAPR